MKSILISFFIFSTLLVKADYGGIHFELSIELLNGKEVHGYRFLSHVSDSEESKEMFINDPSLLLRNQFSDQPGPYNVYQNRLSYKKGEGAPVYLLLDPLRIVLDSIKSMRIISTERSTYAIGLAGEYTIQDQSWMNTEPIGKYVESEDLCSDDIYIHKIGPVLDGVLVELNRIIKSYDEKIKARVAENESKIVDYMSHEMLIKDLVEARRKELESFLYEGSGFKVVVVRMCTC